MTAFGGALDDPTRIMASRVGAYLVDVALGALVVGLWLGVLGGSTWERYEGRFAPEIVCSAVNSDLPALDDPPGADPAGTGCIVVGSSAYIFTEEQAAKFQLQLTLVSVGFGLFNLVLLPALTGASIGKRLFGLRVVTGDGQIARFGRSFVRYLILPVDALCCGIVGLVVANNSRGHRRLGDMAAGTFVVHRSWEGRLLSIPGLQVVHQKHEFGGWGPAPAPEELPLGAGGGIDAPAWDAARGAYVRYDQESGVWFRWDPIAEAWVPVEA